MKKLKNYITFVNESVRDLMKPMSEEEILKKFDKFHPMDMILKGIDRNIPWLVKKGIEYFETSRSLYRKDIPGLLQNIGNHHLRKAIERNDIEIISYLIEKGYKIQRRDIDYAAAHSNIEMIKLLIDGGAVINDDIVRQAMLFRTKILEMNNEEVIKLLKKHSVDSTINKLKNLIK